MIKTVPYRGLTSSVPRLQRGIVCHAFTMHKSHPLPTVIDFIQNMMECELTSG